jgi:hypothetical protein
MVADHQLGSATISMDVSEVAQKAAYGRKVMHILLLKPRAGSVVFLWVWGGANSKRGYLLESDGKLFFRASLRRQVIIFCIAYLRLILKIVERSSEMRCAKCSSSLYFFFLRHGIKLIGRFL